MDIDFVSNDKIENLTLRILKKHQPSALKSPSQVGVLELIRKACVRHQYQCITQPGPIVNGRKACGGVDMKKKILWFDLEIACNAPFDRSFYFIAAHELGHLCLHQKYFTDGQTPYDYCSIESDDFPVNDRLEIQANRFAASLLMPAPMVRIVVANSFIKQEIKRNFLKIIDDGQECNKIILQQIIQDITDCFHISKRAALIRLKELDYIHY